MWWTRLHDCTAWIFWDNGWNAQLYCSDIDWLPVWGGVFVEPHNGYSWHISLEGPFEYHGKWTVEDWDGGYTFSLGSVWAPVTSMWYNEASGYGQLLLDKDAVKEQLEPCLSLDFPCAPHFSFRLCGLVGNC